MFRALSPKLCLFWTGVPFNVGLDEAVAQAGVLRYQLSVLAGRDALWIRRRFVFTCRRSLPIDRSRRLLIYKQMVDGIAARAWRLVATSGVSVMV